MAEELLEEHDYDDVLRFQIVMLTKIQARGSVKGIWMMNSRYQEYAVRKMDGVNLEGKTFPMFASIISENVAVRDEDFGRICQGNAKKRPEAAQGGSGYRLYAENLSQNTSWQDLKDFARKAVNEEKDWGSLNMLQGTGNVAAGTNVTAADPGTDLETDLGIGEIGSVVQKGIRRVLIFIFATGRIVGIDVTNHLQVGHCTDLDRGDRDRERSPERSPSREKDEVKDDRKDDDDEGKNRRGGSDDE
eukprot:524307-Hanusia_phi.AAC.2